MLNSRHALIGPMLTLLLLLFPLGCAGHHSGGGGGGSGAGQGGCAFATVTGTVVSRPPVPGNSGWQFEPDLCKGRYFRLTTKHYETMNPEDNEIDLAPYANKRIKVDYTYFDSFLWHAKIVCAEVKVPPE